MTPVLRERRLSFILHIGLALLTGLALRLLLVLRFPSIAGDSAIYEEFARNWLGAHVYGLSSQNGLTPSDIRGPGYPAFLALVYLVVGRRQTCILLAQAILDLGTCGLVAWMASLFAPPNRPDQRRRVGLAALWLAATCPLTANYATVPLTEVLATFLTAAALIPLVSGCLRLPIASPAKSEAGAETSPEATESTSRWQWQPWLVGSFLVGLGTLVRPEAPLLLVALALVLCVRLRRAADWGKLARIGALSAAGLVLPLLPWAARNWLSLSQVQFLAPRYANEPGEFVPLGLYAWTGTWLARYRDVYQVPWKADGDPIDLSDIPSSAFDSPEQRARTAALLDRYDDNLDWTPDIDAGFAELARQRTARHPLRTYVTVPLERGFTIWFTPRTELLPITGHLTPVAEAWNEDHIDFGATIFFGILNFFYAGIALAGFVRAVRSRPAGLAFRSRPRPADAGRQDKVEARSADGGNGGSERKKDAIPPGFSTAVALLATFVVVRTVFLTTVETPEPRYVLECFPALLALAALNWLKRPAPAR